MTVFLLGFAGTAIGWLANAALERLATASYKLAAVHWGHDGHVGGSGNVR